MDERAFLRMDLQTYAGTGKTLEKVFNQQLKIYFLCDAGTSWIKEI